MYNVTVMWETSALTCSWENLLLKRHKCESLSGPFYYVVVGCWCYFASWDRRQTAMRPNKDISKFCELPAHFGSRLSFFLPLAPMLTRCILSSFSKLSLLFFQRSNPNRRLHLFSFREFVFSGIFSGTGIVWRAVSFCTPSSQCVKCPLVWDHVWLFLLWFWQV